MNNFRRGKFFIAYREQIEIGPQNSAVFPSMSRSINQVTHNSLALLKI
jgi:hypothetical protein